MSNKCCSKVEGPQRLIKSDLFFREQSRILEKRIQKPLRDAGLLLKISPSKISMIVTKIHSLIHNFAVTSRLKAQESIPNKRPIKILSLNLTWTNYLKTLKIKSAAWLPLTPTTLSLSLTKLWRVSSKWTLGKLKIQTSKDNTLSFNQNKFNKNRHLKNLTKKIRRYFWIRSLRTKHTTTRGSLSQRRPGLILGSKKMTTTSSITMSLYPWRRNTNNNTKIIVTVRPKT